MRKKSLFWVRACISFGSLVCFSAAVLAQPVPHDPDPRRTGLRELTPEELMIIETTHPRVIRVKLNKMGLERVNTHRKNKKLPLLSKEAAVDDGQEIQTVTGSSLISADTSGSDAPGSAVAVLPDAVDNSALKYFPPIRSQGGLGSCGTFSGVYYAMTYMIAKARDWDAKTGGDIYRLSPKWGYNMVNGGSDSGSWYYWNYSLGIKHGIATWSEFPYDGVDYKSWSLDPEHWKNAIYRRFDKYGYVSSTNTDSGIALVKQMLVDGYILNIPTYISSWQYKTISDDPSTSADDPYVGKRVCFWVNGTSGYHAMTVVGYNDNIWVDINGNGVVDPGEKGAFRIANSWGTGWGEAGFAWMAYDALKSPSGVSGGPSTNRVMGWSPAMAHWVSARESYTPTLLAQFTVNHLKRNQLGVTLGISDISQNTPSKTWTPSYALYYAGGPYAFNGTSSAVDGTFVFDFSDIAPASTGTGRFYLGLRDSVSGDSAAVSSFKLIDVLNGGGECYSSTVPQTVDAGQIYVPLDCGYDSGNLAPVSEIYARPVSGYVPLTVSFDGSGSYDTDGTISSYYWDFGNGVTASGERASHVYQGAGSFKAALTVTDNKGASAVKDVTITVSADPNILAAPSNLKASAVSKTVTLSWTDNSDNEDGFYVERGVKVKGAVKFQRAAQTGVNQTSYQETILSKGLYAYRVQAFNKTTGSVSSYSNSVNVNIK